MRPATLVHLARHSGVPLPTSDPTERYDYDSPCLPTEMLAAGLLPTRNTDDPAFIELDLGKEYALVAEEFRLGLDRQGGHRSR